MPFKKEKLRPIKSNFAGSETGACPALRRLKKGDLVKTLCRFVVSALTFFACGHIGIVSQTSTAYAQLERVEVGQLTCNVEGGASYIIGSSKTLYCTFDRLGAGVNEAYAGTVNKFGLDIGITGTTVILWSVLAPSSDLPPAALTGTYVGASASASIAIGGGAKVLVGGSDDTIMLQPLSIQAQTGLNVALTVAEVELRAVGIRRDVTYAREEAPCGRTVRLAKGDTLADVAGRCGRSIDDLLEINPQITNVRNIPPQTEIKVPAFPTPSRERVCGTHTTLAQGEGLYDVGRRCGYTVGALLEANPDLQRAGNLRTGRVVNLPAYTSTLSRRQCPRTVSLGAPNQYNDTLSDIARNCGTTIDALLAANPSIANVREIPNGTPITIPRRTLRKASGVCGSHAIAKSGESIVTVADRCNVSVGVLIDANPNTRDLRTLKAGTTIDIPQY